MNVVHITSQTIMILSQQKKRHWSFKHVSVFHSIYELFTVIIISDLRKKYDFEINAALE